MKNDKKWNLNDANRHTFNIQIDPTQKIIYHLKKKKEFHMLASSIT